ncbi:MAG: DUF2809 domain-containing protein [Bacteroidota bacterium]
MTASRLPSRPRWALTALLAGVIALGLASRAVPLFPAVLESYPGDALWSVMVYVGLALLAPRVAPIRLGALALAISFSVEALQLVRLPWLDAIRATLPGRLALGSGFDPVDLLAYTVGVGLALAGDLAWHRVRHR